MSQRYSSTFDLFKECVQHHLGESLMIKYQQFISNWYNCGASVAATVYQIREMELVK